MIKFAVISFPGTNCESETVRAFKRAGMEAEMVLWNDPGILDHSRLDEFAGYCIAGGFSFEDRGRSGVIAAQEPITDILKEEAKKGKVVLGICNGAQILVETGLIPGLEDHSVGMALSWNEMKQDGKLIDTGYYNVWCHLKNVTSKNRSAFNDFSDFLYVPIAHGEGRFMIDRPLFDELEKNGQIVFKYCNEKGEIDPSFPINPNGAVANVAAICNPQGNVMAIMPHPERDPRGNGELIFQSIRRRIESGKESEDQSLSYQPSSLKSQSLPDFDLQFYIRLIITDNTERTIEETLNRKGIKVTLERFEFFGVQLEAGLSFKEVVQKILESGELANLNKQQVYIKTKEGVFQYFKEAGLTSSDLSLDSFVITAAKGDFVGEQKKEVLNHHTPGMVKEIHYGVLWNFVETKPDQVQKAIESKVLHNPFSMTVFENLKT